MKTKILNFSFLLASICLTQSACVNFGAVPEHDISQGQKFHVEKGENIENASETLIGKGFQQLSEPYSGPCEKIKNDKFCKPGMVRRSFYLNGKDVVTVYAVDGTVEIVRWGRYGFRDQVNQL